MEENNTSVLCSLNRFTDPARKISFDNCKNSKSKKERKKKKEHCFELSTTPIIIIPSRLVLMTTNNVGSIETTLLKKIVFS